VIAYYWGAEAWDDLVHAIRTTAEYCLAMAMAAVALGTSFTQLKGLGFKPFLVGIAAAVSVGAVSIVLVFIFAPPSSRCSRKPPYPHAESLPRESRSEVVLEGGSAGSKRAGNQQEMGR